MEVTQKHFAQLQATVTQLLEQNRVEELQATITYTPEWFKLQHAFIQPGFEDDETEATWRWN